MFNMSPQAGSSLGRKHSEKALAKMSHQQSGKGNGFYGKKHTEESKEKMSESLKGNVPWNKGVPHSEETKRKISEAQKGKEAWNKGLTKETDTRVEEYAKKLEGQSKWEDKEHPRGMLGKNHSEEAKKRIGDSVRETMGGRERDSNGKFSSVPD